MVIRPKILVVDDDVANLRLLQVRIKNLGYDVLTAKGGIEALKLAATEEPDAVLLDIMMPEMDGFEVCRRFKEDERLRDVPIIFLTARAEGNGLVKGLEIGAQDYITKPARPEELIARLKVAVRLKMLQQELRERNKEIEAILESIPEGILTLDREGKILHWNSGAKNLTGWRAEEVKDRPYGEILKFYSGEGTPTPEEEDIALAALRQGKSMDSQGRDLYLKTRSGKLIPVMFSVSPLPGSGDKNGLAVTIRDISKQKEVEDSKEELLLSVTHDLKTPLAAIRGFIEMLFDPRVKNRAKMREDILEKLRLSSSALLVLINNLLFVYRACWGRIQYYPGPFELRPICEEVIANFHYVAQEKKLKLESKVPAGMFVQGDMEKIREVLSNLISNATRFTPEGGKIIIEAHRAGEKAEISVKDTGVGIPPGEHGAIFQKFFQGGGSRDGTGLGLYIVKKIMESHGEKVGVESAPGAGSRFYFTLPVAEEEE